MAERFKPEVPLSLLQLNLGEFNEGWAKNAHLRMFRFYDKQLKGLEHIQRNPVEKIHETLNLLEHLLKVRQLMRQAYPKRQKVARSKRRRRSAALA